MKSVQNLRTFWRTTQSSNARHSLSVTWHCFLLLSLNLLILIENKTLLNKTYTLIYDCTVIGICKPVNAIICHLIISITVITRNIRICKIKIKTINYFPHIISKALQRGMCIWHNRLLIILTYSMVVEAAGCNQDYSRCQRDNNRELYCSRGENKLSWIIIWKLLNYQNNVVRFTDGLSKDLIHFHFCA